MLLPDPEKIATQYIKDALDVSFVSTSLPAPNIVAEDGFITVQAVGGISNVETRMRSSVVQIDVWGYHENSNRLPWGRVAELSQQIHRAIESHQNFEVVMPDGYLNALVRFVDITSDFRRVPADDVYARYSGDVIISWTVKEAL